MKFSNGPLAIAALFATVSLVSCTDDNQIKELRERFLSVAMAEAERTLAALGGRLDDAGQASVRQTAEAIVTATGHLGDRVG